MEFIGGKSQWMLKQFLRTGSVNDYFNLYETIVKFENVKLILQRV
jgi:hypothetical protein